MNVLILDNICDALRYKINIKNRDNSGGATVSYKVLNGSRAQLIFLLFLILLIRISSYVSNTNKLFEFLVKSYLEYWNLNNFPRIEIASI